MYKVACDIKVCYPKSQKWKYQKYMRRKTNMRVPEKYLIERHIKTSWRKNIQLAGPGAYARTLPNELLVKIMKDSKQRSDFLDFCHCYDSDPFVCSMGKDNLLAQGEL